MTTDIKKMEVDQADLARILGLSQPSISQAVTAGTFQRTKKGQYNLCSSVITYISKLKSKKTASEADYEKARARKMEADAVLKEIELEKRQEQLVEIEEVADVVRAEYTTVRQRIFAIPNRTAMDIMHLETAQEIQAHLENAINDALAELQYDDIESEAI